MFNTSILSWKAGLAWLLLMMPCAVQAQQYSIKRYGRAEGLVNLNPQCLLQDHVGFLWVGTQNGLFRYDGSQFSRFDTGSGLPGTSIEALHETSNGVLWVGTTLGLAYWNGSGFIRVRLIDGTRDSVLPQALASAKDGTIYAGLSRGLAIVQPDLRVRVVQSERVRGLHHDGAGTLWMWCGTRVCRLDGQQLTPVSEVLDRASGRGAATITDGKGNLWARSSRDVFVRRAGTNQFESAGPIPNSDDISNLALDDKGRVLATTDLGLYRFEQQGTWRMVSRGAALPTSALMSVLEDKEGSLWIGLAGGGLARWPGYRDWTTWSGVEGPGNNNVWAIERDANGTMWVGTDVGLHSLDPTSQRWINWPVVSDRIQTIRASRDGAIWVITGSAVVRVDGHSRAVKRFGTADGLTDLRGFQAMFDSSGRLWVATLAGLFVSTPDAGVNARFHPVKLPSGRRFDVFARDRTNGLWVGGGAGVFHLTRETVEGYADIRLYAVEDGLKADRVARLAQTPDGAIWIGYRGSLGLDRLTAKGIEHFNTDNGLHSNQPITLGTDTEGRLWYGTDSGVEVLDQGAWRLFTKDDGLVWDDVNGNAFFAEPGAVWIGTSLGLARFSLESKSALSHGPLKAMITSSGTAGVTRAGAGPVEFPHGAGTFAANFTALHFANEAAVWFRYRLAGVEQDWTITQARQARYSALHSGNYRFEVQAKVDNGPWGEAAAIQNVRVTPHWWFSPWFAGAFVLVVGLLIWGAWKWRTRRLLDTQHQLERAVAERTTEIERLLVEANRATAFKSQFLANMSHEIRTPMNGIIGLTELTLDETLTAEQRTNLQLVKNSADSLLTILNDILDLSKVEAGKVELESISFSLREHIEGLARMAAVTAERRGLALRCEIDEDVPDRLLGDPHRLRQVLTNLVSNAIKFTEKGEIGIQVRLRPGLEFQFIVSDSGIGIDPELQEHIFGAFQQADGTVTRRFGGTGLGLSIARRLAELMGGRIWLESAPGQGSRFYFTAKFQKSNLDAGTVLKPIDDLAIAPLEILVAEDNVVNQRVIQALLRRRGHRVTLVANGTGAVEQCRRRTFDLVLMDLHMPEMDGLEATRQIRFASPSLRIVALTADALIGDRDRCLKAGMDGYLSKPIDSREFYRVVEQAVVT